MMLPTHALVGIAIALPVTLTFPEFAPAALIGGFLGGIFPDLDLYTGHRRTLHYPTIYPLLVGPAAIGALAFPSVLTVGLALAIVGAAAHCRMDIYGSGLELRPWEQTSEKAVYDHVQKRWIEPRRLVSYDGSPGDLAIATAVGVPLFVVVETPFAMAVAAAIGIGVVYTFTRRYLADLAPVVFGRVPAPLARYVPERYQAETSPLR